jgi:glycyl-tRNA synthetase
MCSQVAHPRLAAGESEPRTVFKIPYDIAPYKLAVLPIVKNKPEIVNMAQEVFRSILLHAPAEYDESQTVGKRYRRQDEAGTPWCVTIDGQSPSDSSVTIRHRDTMQQYRLTIAELTDRVKAGKMSLTDEPFGIPVATRQQQ